MMMMAMEGMSMEVDTRLRHFGLKFYIETSSDEQLEVDFLGVMLGAILEGQVVNKGSDSRLPMLGREVVYGWIHCRTGF